MWLNYHTHTCWYAGPSEYTADVVDAISWLLEMGCFLDELISHTIQLTEDQDGPSIHIYSDDNGVLLAEYHDVTEWVEFKEGELCGK